MAAMGLLEESYRLPLVPPTPATRDKMMSVLQQLKMLGRRGSRVRSDMASQARR